MASPFVFLSWFTSKPKESVEIATNIWFWVAFIGFVLAMLALDLGVFHRKAHAVRPMEAAAWTTVWVALALVFAGGLYLIYGHHVALTFLTGYVIEESLSVDNIFVMVLIFEYFRVPAFCQHRVLFYGIIGALVMRGLFIGLGALLLARFHWVIYIFGAMLIATGVRMAFKHDEEFEGERNPVVRFVRRFVPLTADFHGKRFFVIQDGRFLATPLLLVLLLVEATDLVFAVDSIPAIFGVTRDPFIVFTSNIFAVLGLRSLYFLLAAVVNRFHLLKYGLAVILTFVGLKMIAERFVHIDIMVSLLIILGVLAASIAGSLIWPPRARGGSAPAAEPAEKTGSIFGELPARRRKRAQ
ncbi:MAG TPA: TerC family protein [Gemmatimonadaceae bacterium]|nr:TerC family protein [Gemmatimonadaceae bacterium]